MRPRGIEFLRPIFKLVTNWKYLSVSFSEIKGYYTKYVNNFKHAVANGERPVREAIQAGPAIG